MKNVSPSPVVLFDLRVEGRERPLAVAVFRSSPVGAAGAVAGTFAPFSSSIS